MKTFILMVLIVLIVTPRTQALFGHVAAEKNRRLHVEQQLTQQEQSNSRLHVTISILSAGVVIALVVGAAVGSKARNHHEA